MFQVCLKKFLTIFILLTTATGVSAQDIQQYLQAGSDKLITKGQRQLISLTLDEVIRIALKTSSQIESAIEGEKIAASQLMAAQHKNHINQTISVSEGYSASQTVSDFDDSSAQPYQQYYGANTHIFNTSLNKKDDNGILYSIGFENQIQSKDIISRTRKSENVTNQGKAADTTNSTALSMGMNIPLFQDWGEINQISVQQGQIKLVDSQMASTQVQENIIAQVMSTYWQLMGLWENRNTVTQSIALSNQLLAETKVKVELGILKQLEAAQAEIQLIKDQQTLFNIDKQIATIEDNLKVLLKLEHIKQGVYPSDRPTSNPEPRDIETLKQKAIQASNDISRLKYKLNLNSIEMSDLDNQEKPNIDLTLSYTLKGIGEDFQSGLSQFNEPETNDYRIGISWQIPWNDYQTPEKKKQKLLERNQLERQLQDLHSNIKTAILDLIREENYIKQKIKLTRKTIDLSKSLLNETIEKYKIGNSTMYQVSQYQKDYLSAQEQHTVTLIEQEKINFTIQLKIGEITNKYLN